MRTVISFLAFSILCADNYLLAQSAYIDSLKKFIDTCKNYKEATHKHMDLATELFFTDVKESEAYLKKGLMRAKKENDYTNIGKYYLIRSQQTDATSGNEYAELKLLLADSSIYFYDKAVRAEKEKKEKDKTILNRASALSTKADALMVLGEYEKSVAMYLEAIDNYEGTSLPEKYHGMATLTGSIGGLYHSLGDIKKALEYDQKGLAYLKLSKANAVSQQKGIWPLYIVF